MKIAVRRRFYWYIESHTDGTRFWQEIWRFDMKTVRDNHIQTWGGQALPASHPVVRKINRRLAAGDAIEFPVQLD